jgi:hypothetical protein
MRLVGPPYGQRHDTRDGNAKRLHTRIPPDLCSRVSWTTNWAMTRPSSRGITPPAGEGSAATSSGAAVPATARQTSCAVDDHTRGQLSSRISFPPGLSGAGNRRQEMLPKESRTFPRPRIGGYVAIDLPDQGSFIRRKSLSWL